MAILWLCTMVLRVLIVLAYHVLVLWTVVVYRAASACVLQRL